MFYRECYECGQRWELGIGSTCKCESIGESMSSSEDGKMTDRELMEMLYDDIERISDEKATISYSVIIPLRNRLCQWHAIDGLIAEKKRLGLCDETNEEKKEDWYGQYQWECGYQRGWDNAMESLEEAKDNKMTDLELMQLALASLVGASIHDPEVTQEAIEALRDRLKEKNEDE